MLRRGLAGSVDVRSIWTIPLPASVIKCCPGVETVVIGEVDLEILRRNRMDGTVTPLKDRRTDLYNISFREV